MDGMNACFYTGVRRPQDFDLYPWYATDVEILKQAGLSVHVSKSPFDISLKSDLYFAWWPTSGALPLIVAKSRRKPFLLIAGGDDVVTETPHFGYWARNAAVRSMIRTCVRNADHVIAVSKHAAEQAQALGARRLSTVYNAIDCSFFSPGFGGGRDFVCIVAQLTSYYLRRKPVATLIRAMPEVLARYPDARLVIIGRPAEGATELQCLASELGISNSIAFLGSVTTEEKLRRLQTAFAYVQPTLHEAFGVAIAEAMSCGRPVITSPVAAVPEVVGDCGLFAEPNDASGFSRQMLYLLDKPRFAEEMGRRARERVMNQFSVSERRRGLHAVLATFASGR
jgi:glycosyltransferase involved in cell wall biosynthesis